MSSLWILRKLLLSRQGFETRADSIKNAHATKSMAVFILEDTLSAQEDNASSPFLY